MVLQLIRISVAQKLKFALVNRFYGNSWSISSRGLSSLGGSGIDSSSESIGTGSRRENAFGYATPDSQVSRKERHSKYKFVDKVQVAVNGGRGGNGCVSFEVLAPGKKRPHGGNGGAGGDVYLVAEPTLTSFTFQTFHLNAASGGHGGSDGQKGARGRDLYVKVPLGTVVTERLEDFWEDGGAAHTEEDAEGLDEMLEGAEVEDSDSDGTDDGPTGEASDESDESDLSDDDELAGTSSGHSLANRGLAPSLPVVRLSALVYPARALEAARSKDHSSSKADIGPALGRGGKESLPLIDYSVCGELAELSSLSPEEQKQRARQKHRMERRITSKKQKEQHGWILPSPADNAQTFGSSAFGTIDGIAPPQRASVDMDVPGVPLRVAVGGAPGLGNRAYAGTGSSRAKSLPKSRLPGRAGISRQLLLELRLIADVGLVGAPNAGKSSLLRALSNARPLVAPFAFSTLRPGLGVVEYSDLERITVADIPGLIPGASEDRGLGVAFLRHLLRTKVLVYVLDGAGSEGRDPLTDLKSLLHEVAQFDLAMAGGDGADAGGSTSDSLRTLLSKPAIIFSNKADIEENIPGCRARLRTGAASLFNIAIRAARDEEAEGPDRSNSLGGGATGLFIKEVIEGSAMRGGPGIARLAVAMREAVEAVRAAESNEAPGPANQRKQP